MIINQWNTQRPDLDVKAMALIGRIKHLNQHLTKEMTKNCAAHKLNFASFDVLATLRRSGPPFALSPNALLDTMMVTSVTMTNRIDQLVKAGWVERIANPDDGRSFIIALTDSGFEVIDATVTEHVEVQKRLTSGLNAKEQLALNALLDKFLESFE